MFLNTSLCSIFHTAPTQPLNSRSSFLGEDFSYTFLIDTTQKPSFELVWIIPMIFMKSIFSIYILDLNCDERSNIHEMKWMKHRFPFFEQISETSTTSLTHSVAWYSFFNIHMSPVKPSSPHSLIQSPSTPLAIAVLTSSSRPSLHKYHRLWSAMLSYNCWNLRI